MSTLTLKVTTAGRAALVNAQNTGTLPVQVSQIGVTETAFTANPAGSDAALPGELKRSASIAGSVVADDTIHVMLNDNGADAYTMRGFALYLSDGTLFALYGQAGAIINKSAQSVAMLAIDVKFADIDAASITFGDSSFTNPPATTETPGVVELATAAETKAGLDDQRAVTPAGLDAALDERLAPITEDIKRATRLHRPGLFFIAQS